MPPRLISTAISWPGPGQLWDAVGTTLAAELARYAAVLHLAQRELA